MMYDPAAARPSDSVMRDENWNDIEIDTAKEEPLCYGNENEHKMTSYDSLHPSESIVFLFAWCNY